MKIRTYDTQYLVTDERGRQIQEALLSDNPPEWVNLNGDMVKASAILALTRGGYTAADKAGIELAGKQPLGIEHKKLLK